MPGLMFRAYESAHWQQAYNHVGHLASRVLLDVPRPQSAPPTSASPGEQHHYLLEDAWRISFLHSVHSAAHTTEDDWPSPPSFPVSNTTATTNSLPELFTELLAHFATELQLWMRYSILYHPRCTSTRARLTLLAASHKLPVETVGTQLVAGYVRGYLHGRQPLLGRVHHLLAGAVEQQQAALREAAVELGVVLSARHMLRAFAGVVIELTAHLVPVALVPDLDTATATLEEDLWRAEQVTTTEAALRHQQQQRRRSDW